jgi:CHAT domain-containing protein
VRLVRGLLGSPQSDPRLADPVLSGLYQSLIGPAVQGGWLAGSRRLLVATHGTLTYLPFAALRDPRTGRYLAESYAVLHVPSGAALTALRQRGDPARLVKPKPSRGAAFVPLPRALAASGLEARAVARQAGVRSVVGRGATEGAVRQALRDGGLVHVATHGYMNPGNPMLSRLALRPAGSASEDDGRLEVHELLEERITSPLVFLSGCETGVGGAWSTSFAAGDDFVTLAQAFLYAGAKNVVATLWPVQDRAAAELADAYYAALGIGDPVAALGEAQQALLRQDRYAHPYHWAGYRITGAGPPRLPAKPTRMSVSH